MAATTGIFAAGDHCCPKLTPTGANGSSGLPEGEQCDLTTGQLQHEPASRPAPENTAWPGLGASVPTRHRIAPNQDEQPQPWGEGFPLWRVGHTIPVLIVAFLFTIEQLSCRMNPRELRFFSLPCRHRVFASRCRLAFCLGRTRWC
jgi:hypothetical protein